MCPHAPQERCSQVYATYSCTNCMNWQRYNPRPRQGSPLAQLVFQKPGKGGFERRLVISPEGIHISSILLPLSQIPEDTKVCNAEQRPGDGGRYGRCSGDSCHAITYNDDGYTRVQLPSGRKVPLLNVSFFWCGQIKETTNVFFSYSIHLLTSHFHLLTSQFYLLILATY